ncbi:hypothetical protein FRC10_011968 [Ceratobasidium sp. 414]|nr:hypothetical protein FRC10_011968 [Ceratobasidium sp. 414]
MFMRKSRLRPIQSSHNPTPKSGITDRLANGSDVKRSLDSWKTNRTLLATAIECYLAACADLNAVCARASRRAYDRKDLESALAAVDAGLEGLTSEAESLCSAKTSLAATRNLSTTLAPIHTLPPEVLTRIFTMVPSAYRLTFTAISSYWRQVALNTPSLWTWMNIAHQNHFTYDHVSLKRSNDLLLDFHVSGDYPDDEDHLLRQLAFFTEAIPRIRMLDITSRPPYPDETNIADILLAWLRSSVGATKELRLQVPPSAPSPLSWDLTASSDEHAEAVLGALTVLHLSNILIPFHSAAYRGLVDLRLVLEGYRQFSVSISLFADIFAANPDLSTLKLSGFVILRSENPNATAPVPLIHLKVVCLVNLDDDSLELVTSLIPLSRCLSELSIGLEIDGGNSHLIEGFLRGAHVKTLACATFGDRRGRWPLLLSTVIPSLEHLIIRQFKPLDPLDIRPLMAELEERKAENGLNKELQPRLPHVYLVSGRYDDDDLRFVTRMLGVQKLHVERCKKIKGQGKLSRLEPKLPKAPPNSVCTFREVDTTAEWPCRMMFDQWV